MDRVTPKPYWEVTIFENSNICCQASWARDSCFANLEAQEALANGEGLADGETHRPTEKPTPSPIDDNMIEITMLGSLTISKLDVPSSWDSSDWPKLRTVLIQTIMSVMTKSLICHPGLVVKVSTYGMQPFPLQNTSGKKKRNRNRQGRRNLQAASNQLSFEMTVPTKCDEDCQLARGHLGMRAFDELYEHFSVYINLGLFSSTLKMIGLASGFLGADDAPTVTSGTLSYRQAVLSSITWVPTFNPTIVMPTSSPTLSPTGSPTEEIVVTNLPSISPSSGTPTISPTTTCSVLKWHYGGDTIGCTDNQNYPDIWDTIPALGASLLFNNLEACCLQHGSAMCLVSHTCLVEGTTYCGAMGDRKRFHPTSPEKRMCSSDKNYPPVWDTLGNMFLFNTPEHCCAEYYSDGRCFVSDPCLVEE